MKQILFLLLSTAALAGTYKQTSPSIFYSTVTLPTLTPAGVCTNDVNGLLGTVASVPIANGGSGQTTQAAAITALTGAQSSGKYLRSDGVNSTLSSLAMADSTGVLSPINGGTGVVNNSASTLAISGNFPLQFTISSATTVVIPAGGTMATTSNTETFVKKSFNDPITFAQVATPANPASGFNKLYFKSDNNLYLLTSGGTETLLISTLSAPGSFSWTGYFPGSGTNYWQRTANTYGDFSIQGTIPAITQTRNKNFGTVTGAASSLPGVAFTAPRTGTIEIDVFYNVNGTNTQYNLKLTETNTSTDIGVISGFAGALNQVSKTLKFDAISGTAYNMKLLGQTSSGADTISLPYIGSGNSDIGLEFSMTYIN